MADEPEAQEPERQPEAARDRPAMSRLAVAALLLAPCTVLICILASGTRSRLVALLVDLSVWATFVLSIAAFFKIGATRHPVWGGILAAAAMMILLCGLPSNPRFPENAKRASCRTSLQQISIAAHLYADDFDGEFPAGFLPLYTSNYTDNPKIFSCDSAPASYNDFKLDGTLKATSTSYAYVAGLKSGMPGGFIIVYDKVLDNHKKDGRNVLRIDSSVEWWKASREPEFQRRLALQAEAVAKWRASGKPVTAIGEFISPELRDLMAK